MSERLKLGIDVAVGIVTGSAYAYYVAPTNEIAFVVGPIAAIATPIAGRVVAAIWHYSRGVETHETCTSTSLDRTRGSRPEHINTGVLDNLHRQYTGTRISGDHLTAIIQREQAIARHKREKPK
jgi:hypothetical protein